MPDYPDSAFNAALAAVIAEPSVGDTLAARIITRSALDAAAPVLAAAVAERIIAHMETHGPKRQPGANADLYNRPLRAWRRYLRIAAQVASRAFTTRDEEMRQAAEALASGNYAVCVLDDAGRPMPADPFEEHGFGRSASPDTSPPTGERQ